MIKIIFIAALIGSLFVSQAFAQTEKGNWLLGGNASLNANTNSGSYTIIQLSPLIGGFVANKFAVGASIPLSYYKDRYGKITSFGLMPFVRYYFATTEKYSLFGHAAFGFERATIKYNSGYYYGREQNSNSTSGIVGLGYTYFLNKSIGLEGLFNYNWIGGDNSDSNIGLNVGFQIYFGKGQK
jgi:hypothetical protein